MAYAVVRTDNMYGTDVRAALVSVEYQESGAAAAIENGNVVKLGALKAGEREIFIGTAVAATTPIEEVVLIASPEVMYDEHKHNLDQFVNEVGDICRGYRLHSGDLFSVTAEAFANASPAVGQVVELAAGTKLNNVASATSGSTVVGKIIAKEAAGRYTYYVIEVA